jgi:hypothetical protein
MFRDDGRGPFDLRVVTIERNVNRYAEGSALISFGETRVLCTASVEEKVPPFSEEAEAAGLPPNTPCFPGRLRRVLFVMPSVAALEGGAARFSVSSDALCAPE